VIKVQTRKADGPPPGLDPHLDEVVPGAEVVRRHHQALVAAVPGAAAAVRRVRVHARRPGAAGLRVVAVAAAHQRLRHERELDNGLDPQRDLARVRHLPFYTVVGCRWLSFYTGIDWH
jgi:hypothetical protein